MGYRNRNLLFIIDEGDPGRFRTRTVQTEKEKLAKTRARRKAIEQKEIKDQKE